MPKRRWQGPNKEGDHMLRFSFHLPVHPFSLLPLSYPCPFPKSFLRSTPWFLPVYHVSAFLALGWTQICPFHEHPLDSPWVCRLFLLTGQQLAPHSSLQLDKLRLRSVACFILYAQEKLRNWKAQKTPLPSPKDLLWKFCLRRQG